MRKTLLIGALAALGGCGGDSGSAFEGVYVITEWTVNDAACSEGPSILPQAETAMYLKYENFLGTRFLNGVLCADVAECVELAREDTIHLLRGPSFEEGNDRDGWTGGISFASGDDQGNCSGDFIEHVLTGEPGVEIRIESSTIPVDGFQEDADGFCPYEDAKAAAQDGTCTGLEVMVATYETDF